MAGTAAATSMTSKNYSNIPRTRSNQGSEVHTTLVKFEFPRPPPISLRDARAVTVARAISSVVERFVHTEEVTGSNPVSPTVSLDFQ